MSFLYVFSIVPTCFSFVVHLQKYGYSTGGVQQTNSLGEAEPQGQHYGNGLARRQAMRGMGTFEHELFTGWIGRLIMIVL